MHPDVQALLALQEQDGELDDLDARVRALAQREASLDRERAAGAAALERARAQLAAEEKRERELAAKLREHKQLQEKFQSQMDAVRKPREASAAMTQMDMARRVLAADESELQALAARLADLRQAAELHEMELAELDARQGAERAAIGEERSALAEQASAVHARRAQSAHRVSAGALGKYERLRKRGERTPLFKLHETSCGRCHVAIPLQRRHAILSGRTLEVCEACGVLLYAVV
ncbi:MAG TPA: hypothetical protein VFS05_11065 [Gemmatimonadaceae bacterium]|nr:hypothetical protein [Gemmatimonadaceae bacterium]